MVKLIAAIGPNNLIGVGNKMAWHIREEFDHFRATTNGHALLFGKVTFKGLPKKLPNRKHYVLDFDPVEDADVSLSNLDQVRDLIAKYHKMDNKILFIAGGKFVFETFYKYADELIISEVNTNVKGDVYLDWDLSSYNKKLIKKEEKFNVYSYTKQRQTILQHHYSWNEFFNQEKVKNYFPQLLTTLKKEYQNKSILPSKINIFNAFRLTSLNDLKVIILGQDPYPNKKDAHGLAFSSLSHKTPESLKNIFKELKENYANVILNTNDLSPWAKQGVLLINGVLTVQENKSHSHQNIGWEIFSINLFKYLNTHFKNLIFVLWGKYAKENTKYISNKNIILESPHPSPLSAYRGFFGNKHFLRINEILEQQNIKKINWNLE